MDERKTVLDWLVAQPIEAWFDTADVAKGTVTERTRNATERRRNAGGTVGTVGSGVDPARAFEALRALEQVGYVTGYYGGSGPLMYYASTKARREAVQGG